MNLLSSRSPGRPKNDLAPTGGGSDDFSDPGAQPTRPAGLPTGAWGAGEPLWKRAPKRDAQGQAYTDFLMFCPGFNKLAPLEVERRLNQISQVLARFGDWVVFVEVNLKLNTLWVSMRQQPGLMSLVIAALREQQPGFKLVGQDPRAY